MTSLIAHIHFSSMHRHNFWNSFSILMYSFRVYSRFFYSTGRKLSAQLRAKIRSLDESYPITTSSSSAVTGRNGTSLLTRETSYVISSSAGTSNAVTSSAATAAVSSSNIIHNELHGSGGDDCKSLHSDSSLSDITSGETTMRSKSISVLDIFKLSLLLHYI